MTSSPASQSRTEEAVPDIRSVIDYRFAEKAK